jgi:hypothetical protein
VPGAGSYRKSRFRDLLDVAHQLHVATGSLGPRGTGSAGGASPVYGGSRGCLLPWPGMDWDGGDRER